MMLNSQKREVTRLAAKANSDATVAQKTKQNQTGRHGASSTASCRLNLKNLPADNPHAVPVKPPCSKRITCLQPTPPAFIINTPSSPAIEIPPAVTPMLGPSK
jgi:hypothetical protein